MPILLENIREIGSFKVTAECLVEMAPGVFNSFLQGLPCHFLIKQILIIFPSKACFNGLA